MLFPTSGSAQSEFLHQFTAIQNETTVHLSFTIAGGVTCLGTDIERSSDSAHFSTIGTIAGVCGSSSEDVEYSFDDTKPLANQNNYYRLLLGQVGYTETIKVQFIDYSSGAVVYPNPVTDQTTIFFPNSKKEFFRLKLFDAAGILKVSLQTENASVDLNRGIVGAGIYFFTIEKNSVTIYKGKIAVL